MKNILLTILLTTACLVGAQKAKAQTDYYEIAMNYSDDDLVAYPNPTTGVVHILLREASSQIVKVDVMDLNGQVIRSYKYPTNSYILDVDMSNLPFGLYSVNIFVPGEVTENVKVVKN